jgi:hypothetical protein
MSGFTIYYVPPRLVGSVRNWSGLESGNGESEFLQRIQDNGFNGIWFSPLTQSAEATKRDHGQIVNGSYYATRDPFSFDTDVSSGNAERDKEHFLHFNRQAAEKGIPVYADMVFNHLSADHPLVLEENAEILAIQKKTHGHFKHVHGTDHKLIGIAYVDGGERKVFHFKFKRKDDLELLIGGPVLDPWEDVAQVNYASPAGKRFFLEGDAEHEGYFKQVMDWHFERGFTALRLDAAYKIPPEVLTELIGYAHVKHPGVLTLVETLGASQEEVARLSAVKIRDANGQQRLAFDHGMLGTFWWNMVDDWLLREQHPSVLNISLFGGAGSPDNHDTDGTLAGNLRKHFNGMAARGEALAIPVDTAIARASVRDYAICVLACNSAYMQMGFELCNEKQNSVFRGQVSPQDWDKLVQERAGTALDIRSQIQAINRLKADLGVENCRVDLIDHALVRDGKVVKIHYNYVDVDTGVKTAELVLFLNMKVENGPVALGRHACAVLEKDGLLQHGAKSPDASMVADYVVYHTPLKNAAPVPGGRVPPPAILRSFGP